MLDERERSQSNGHYDMTIPGGQASSLLRYIAIVTIVSQNKLIPQDWPQVKNRIMWGECIFCGNSMEMELFCCRSLDLFVVLETYFPWSRRQTSNGLNIITSALSAACARQSFTSLYSWWRTLPCWEFNVSVYFQSMHRNIVNSFHMFFSWRRSYRNTRISITWS